MSKSQGSSEMEDSSSSSSDKAPIPSVSKSDSKTVQQSVVEDLLECTICLEVPASPIHNCSNGHIICGLCADNVKKCGLCNSKPLHVSCFAERLSRQLEFKSRCPNYDDGCRNLVPSTEIKEHIPKCYYRNVMCNECHVEVCKKVSISLKDFPRHLEERHKYMPRSTVTRTKIIDGIFRERTRWRLEFSAKDDKYFVMHNHMEYDSIYFWVTVLADKEVAQKYSYELTLENKVDDGKQRKSSWTMPVLPYHDFPKFRVPSPMFITVPEKVFYEFCDKEEYVGNLYYVFTVSHRIL